MICKERRGGTGRGISNFNDAGNPRALFFFPPFSRCRATVSNRTRRIENVLMLEKPGSPSVNGTQTSHIRKRSIRGGFRDQTQQQLQRSYNNNSNARQSLITPFLNQSSPSVAPANLPQTPAKTESAPSVLTLNSSRSSSPSASPSRSVDTSQILKGVVACLDIRLERKASDIVGTDSLRSSFGIEPKTATMYQLHLNELFRTWEPRYRNRNGTCWSLLWTKLNDIYEYIDPSNIFGYDHSSRVQEWIVGYTQKGAKSKNQRGELAVD